MKANKICRRPECATASVGCYYRDEMGECAFPPGGSLDRWPITPWDKARNIVPIEPVIE